MRVCVCVCSGVCACAPHGTSGSCELAPRLIGGLCGPAWRRSAACRGGGTGRAVRVRCACALAGMHAGRCRRPLGQLDGVPCTACIHCTLILAMCAASAGPALAEPPSYQTAVVSNACSSCALQHRVPSALRWRTSSHPFPPSPTFSRATDSARCAACAWAEASARCALMRACASSSSLSCALCARRWLANIWRRYHSARDGSMQRVLASPARNTNVWCMCVCACKRMRTCVCLGIHVSMKRVHAHAHARVRAWS